MYPKTVSLAEQLKLNSIAQKTRLHHCHNRFSACFTRSFVSEKSSKSNLTMLDVNLRPKQKWSDKKALKLDFKVGFSIKTAPSQDERNNVERRPRAININICCLIQRSVFTVMLRLKRNRPFFFEIIRDCSHDHVVVLVIAWSDRNFLHSWLRHHLWKWLKSPICSLVQLSLIVPRTDRFPIQLLRIDNQSECGNVMGYEILEYIQRNHNFSNLRVKLTKIG